MRNNNIYKNDIEKISNLKLPWDKLKGKTILISGVTGMIGTVIVDCLMLRNKLFNDDISIIGISRNEIFAKERFSEFLENKNFKFIKQDIKNKFDVEEENIDYIIHAASNTHPIQYSKDPVGTILTNIKGTENLWEIAKKHNTKRFIFLSSVEIYGENRGDINSFSEDYLGYIDCNTLRAGYPESKRLGESLCQAFSEECGIETVIARLSRVYGPTMLKNDSKAIAQFIRNAVNDEDIILKSEGSQRFSFCYVIDAVSAIFTILFCGDNKAAYNVSDTLSDVSLKELSYKIAKISNRRVKFMLPDESESKGFSKATIAIMNSEKLISLGWQALTSIDSGIEKTITLLKEGFE